MEPYTLYPNRGEILLPNHRLRLREGGVRWEQSQAADDACGFLRRAPGRRVQPSDARLP
ncbi:hypothetical protein LINPERPRIM_LOCUS3255 [Linum perenne]